MAEAGTVLNNLTIEDLQNVRKVVEEELHEIKSAFAKISQVVADGTQPRDERRKDIMDSLSLIKAAQQTIRLQAEHIYDELDAEMSAHFEAEAKKREDLENFFRDK